MENVYFNLDSIESSYGENILTAVIQIDERISDLEAFFLKDESLNDFEKLQVVEKLNKINELNDKIHGELALQMQRIIRIQQGLNPAVISES